MAAMLTDADYKTAFADRERAAAIKAECERIWNCGSPEYSGNRTIWQGFDEDTGRMTCEAGAPCRTSAGATAASWFRKYVSSKWGPPPPSGAEFGSATCPKWLRERFRRECPRNAAALIAGYGKTDSLAGKSREYIEALQRGPSLPGLVSAETTRDAAPIAPAAPAIDPAAMSDEALETAAAPIFADVAREIATFAANVAADRAADAARQAAETAAECPPAAPEPVTAPEPPKAASARRSRPARRARDMAPPTIWQARALGLVAAPSKKPRAEARHAWSR